MKRTCLLLIFAFLFIFVRSSFAGGKELGVPTTLLWVKAYDTPSDGGKSITLEWEPSPVEFQEKGEGKGNVIRYDILRSLREKGPFSLLQTVPRGTHRFQDERTEDGKDYFYIIQAVGKSGNSSDSPVTGPVSSRPQWFNRKRTPILYGMSAYLFLLLFCIAWARKGKELFIRRIAGLEAIDEAIGRATEMGRPILYVAGLGPLADIATLASLNILGRVARKVAEYEVPLIAPCRYPLVMIVERQVVKEAYMEAGRPDAYREDSIFYLSSNQFAYTAGVNGIMLRERPATNFYLGWFYAESLILAETGAATGAIQIAGTDALAQIPFFITACDYTLIGEELYAASAYMAREPLLLGTLKGQDWGKAALMLLIVIGIILESLGVGFSQLFMVK